IAAAAACSQTEAPQLHSHCPSSRKRVTFRAIIPPFVATRTTTSSASLFSPATAFARTSSIPRDHTCGELALRTDSKTEIPRMRIPGPQRSGRRGRGNVGAKGPARAEAARVPADGGERPLGEAEQLGGLDARRGTLDRDRADRDVDLG